MDWLTLYTLFLSFLTISSGIPCNRLSTTSGWELFSKELKESDRGNMNSNLNFNNFDELPRCTKFPNGESITDHVLKAMLDQMLDKSKSLVVTA